VSDRRAARTSISEKRRQSFQAIIPIILENAHVEEEEGAGASADDEERSVNGAILGRLLLIRMKSWIGVRARGMHSWGADGRRGALPLARPFSSLAAAAASLSL
jgi:hypothetical protein